jgi:cytoskeletal protein RodZ
MTTTTTTPQDLATLRNKKGLSLHQIANATKITIRYLEAIECGQFAKLPGGIYSVSYIRQYAKAIEVSEETIMERYLQWAPPASLCALPFSQHESAAHS